MIFTLVFVFKGRAVAKAVGRVPFRAEARVRSQVRPCGTCSGQIGAGAGFSPSILVLSCQFHSTMLHTHLYLHVAFIRTTKGRSLGTSQKAMLFSEIGEHWIEECLHCLSIFKILNK
jgi:hypothetical protein